MLVLVTGGRDFYDFALFEAVMASLSPVPTRIRTGDARGADRLARDWAKESNIPVEVFVADWDSIGKIAGIIRNMDMIADKNDLPDLCIGFPGRSGTWHMMDNALEAGIPVLQVFHNGDTKYHEDKREFRKEVYL